MNIIARTPLADWLLKQAAAAEVPITFEMVGLEADVEEGDHVLYAMPNNRRIPAVVRQVEFDSHIGAWKALIESQRPAFSLHVWVRASLLEVQS